MGADSFEVVVKSCQISGDYKPAWKLFVNTKFYVSIIPSSEGSTTEDFRFHIFNNPERGQPTLHISEVASRLANPVTNKATLLHGGKIVTLLSPDIDVAVSLSDRVFGIPAAQISWLKSAIQPAKPAPAAAAKPASFDKGYAAWQANNYALAHAELRPLAEQGGALAQFFCGDMCEHGKGIPKNDQEAVKWYRLSAEQGNPMAQNGLGTLCARGTGTAQNHQEAVKWFRLAANGKLALAQFNLGGMFVSGQGVKKNEIVAYALFSLVAQQVPRANDQRLRLIAKLAPGDVMAGHALQKELAEPGKLLSALDRYLQKNPA